MDEDNVSTAQFRFALPAWRAAVAPPEVRGAGRDDVRLLVTRGERGTVEHLHFTQLATALGPGDLLVVNTSRTLPAALWVQRVDDLRLRVHVSGEIRGRPANERLIELRHRDRPWVLGRPGETLTAPQGRVELLAAHSRGTLGPRLWRARLHGTSWAAWMEQAGEPVRYDYVKRRWPLSAYWTPFADEDGSAEMPSAGRPFSHAVLASLRRAGVAVAPVLLHTGLASPEVGERPYDEFFRVGAQTVRQIRRARRVIAVGTTVVRALESAAPTGTLEPREGWTSHMVTPEVPPRVVHGLLTGFHEPKSTHLQMLRAVASDAHVRSAYAAALRGDYLWHEFGDLHLMLPCHARAAR